MLDMIKGRASTIDEANPELPRLKAEFAKAEKAYASAREEIKAAREADTGGSEGINAFRAMSVDERRRLPSGVSRKTARIIEAARDKRDAAAQRMEDLKLQIAEATTAAMKTICAEARPAYEKELRKFWAAYLAQREAELVAVEGIVAIRTDLEARRIRMTGLPVWTETQRRTAEASAALRAEVVELIAEGSLTKADVPSQLQKMWRL